MLANTVYDVFLALPDEEQGKFIVLVNNYKNRTIKVDKSRKKRTLFSKNDAIQYLLENVFKSKT